MTGRVTLNWNRAVNSRGWLERWFYTFPREGRFGKVHGCGQTTCMIKLVVGIPTYLILIPPRTYLTLAIGPEIRYKSNKIVHGRIERLIHESARHYAEWIE